ncbi:translocation and assembly module lipoprotein TamL [Prevotella sp.]|uniref:translocation and assembly module lipoprotein TamL n=1 Tax=Prevotella sp. TaxID=59823 RepID=UPI002F9537FA
MKRKLYIWLLLGVSCLLSVSCSSTSGVPEGDQLYTGISKINYTQYEKSPHFVTTSEEIEAALACEPNGAFLGSSYYRTPFPYRLWIWNAFHDSDDDLSKWITKTFGKAPVLISWVNPALRASVARSVLRNHGYFRGNVDYEIKSGNNPKKAKLGYTVNMGRLFTIDTLTYEGFPHEADSLIHTTHDKAAVKSGDPFNVASLDAERSRISTLFRNNGYYYYQPGYASYLADTLSASGQVNMKMKLIDNLPEKAKHKWYIGKVDLELRKQFMETLNDTIRRRRLTVHFNGRRSPLRPRVILRDLKLRPGRLYSYDQYLESSNKIISSGMFSSVDFQFTPRDSSATCDTLDLRLNCVFDKPYDFYVETNYTGRTSGRMGPGLVIGLTKRNAFHGGEKLDINLKGSYEWQTGGNLSGSGDKINSYEYGGDISLELPRLVLPILRRHRFYTTPTTLLKASTSVINRASFFKRHVVSGELSYTFQTSETSMHQFTPLVLQYDYMSGHTEKFDSILKTSPYLQVTMADHLVPKMRYSYIYSSPTSYRNPIWWQTTVSEAANFLSLGYLLAGNKWNERGKRFFKNPYTQFFKIETELRKTWRLTEHDELVGHVSGGAIWSYGNSDAAPWSEQFYVGGANSIRAFTVRTIGPGAYQAHSNTTSYLDQTGDIKLQFNLEYRPRLFGNLYGALFLDAGNVWAMRNDETRPNSTLKLKSLLKDMALGTGIGLRYNLDFFVIRVDWGVGLHIPGASGFYNIPRFKDGQSLHLAIGYPF